MIKIFIAGTDLDVNLPVSVTTKLSKKVILVVTPPAKPIKTNNLAVKIT